MSYCRARTGLFWLWVLVISILFGAKMFRNDSPLVPDDFSEYRWTLPLNEATPSELQLLPGIGPVRAFQWVRLRKKIGPFRSFKDLEKIEGIGPSTREGIAKSGFARILHAPSETNSGYNGRNAPPLPQEQD